MVMASTAADQTNDGIEKAKIDGAQQTVDTGLPPGRRPGRRLPQADLSGFIGADVWMVGKYER